MCKDCPGGYYSDEEGLENCKPCPEGTYHNLAK